MMTNVTPTSNAASDVWLPSQRRTPLAEEHTMLGQLLLDDHT